MGKSFHKWHPIEDLPLDYTDMKRLELDSLAQVWGEQKETLRNSQSLKDFNEKLKRAWSIETGLLERIYSFDRGVTETLIELGIDAAFLPSGSGDRDPDLIVAIIADHKEVIEGLFDFVDGSRELGTSYIRELQAVLTRNQETCSATDQFGKHVEVPLLRGEYKRLPNNPVRVDGLIHEYCPPEHVDSEMERLIAFHRKHIQNKISPEVEAGWLHHRFTQIHPFQDGNGRVARCLATIILLKADWFPLVVKNTESEKGRYIDSLEKADAGDLLPLIQFFASLQKRAFVQALGLSAQVLNLLRVDQIISVAKSELEQKERVHRSQWLEAKQTAARLQEAGRTRLMEIAARMSAEIAQYFAGGAFRIDDESPTGLRGHYFRQQIVETAKLMGYFANLSDYHAWTRLVLQTDKRCEILLSYHSIGFEYRGVLAVSASFFMRSETGPDEREVSGLEALSDDIFQINYKESADMAEERYGLWLEGVLVKGLGLWRSLF